MSTTTDRRYVCQLGHNEQISQVFLASEKQLRPNRNGNLYLQLQLSDRSGAIAARLWNASENDYRAFENGDYVKVEGNTQLFQGNMQLIASTIRRARPDEVDEVDFRVLRSDEIDRMATRLAEILRTIKSPELRNLAECFLMDTDFMAKFTTAPAGMKNHHAYQGGLMEHVVGLMELVLVVAPRYPRLDPGQTARRRVPARRRQSRRALLRPRHRLHRRRPAPRPHGPGHDDDRRQSPRGRAAFRRTFPEAACH